MELLPAEQVEELRKLARENVDKSKRDQARADLLKQFEAEERAKGDPDEDLLEHTVQLPPSSNCLMIDGVQFFHGQTYDFGRRVYNSVVEMEQNAWRHEEVTFGQRNPNAYKRPTNAKFGETSRAADFTQPRI